MENKETKALSETNPALERLYLEHKYSSLVGLIRSYLEDDLEGNLVIDIKKFKDSQNYSCKFYKKKAKNEK